MSFDSVVDYSDARPSQQALEPYQGVVRYVGGTGSKVLTRTEFEELVSWGKKVVFNYEFLTTDYEGGFSGGQNAAHTALNHISNYGLSAEEQFVLFSVDTGISFNPTVAAYFQGIATVMQPGLHDCYGDPSVIQGLRNVGLVGVRNWRTMSTAWPGGSSTEFCALVQTGSGELSDGSSVDFNEALAVDYGQYPRPIVTPPTPPPSTMEIDMFLVQEANRSPVYITNGVNCRWIANPADRNAVEAAYKGGLGNNGSVVVIPDGMLEAVAGLLVGPVPTT